MLATSERSCPPKNKCREKTNTCWGEGTRTDPGHPGYNALGPARRVGPGRGQTPPEQQRAAARTGPAPEFPGRRTRLTASGVGARDPRTGTRSRGARGRPTRAPPGPRSRRPPRESAPGRGSAGAEARAGENRALPGLRAAPRRRFPGPARGVRPRRPLSPPRRGLRWPGRRSSGAAPPRGASLAGAGSGHALPRRGRRRSGARRGKGLPRAAGGRARTRAPPPEPLRYRSGDDDQGRVVAANLSEGH